MAIDDYYEHIYKKEFEKDKHITDNYDEFFGDDIDDMLNQVPSILELIISFKPMDIKSYMPNEFYFRYKMFVKDNYEYLYNKYLQKTLVAEIYQEINI